MGCDLCGKEGELFKTEIEGSVVNACKSCSRFGKVISTIVPKATIKEKQKIIKQQAIQATRETDEPEIIYEIKPNYASLIQRKRGQLGLKQEEFAKKVAEKASVINNIESGKLKPPLKLAAKIEKFLGIKLINEVKIETVAGAKKGSNEAMTLGDMIKIR